MTSLATASTTGRPAGIPFTSRIQKLPILVLFPHNRCNCRCVMCDIWQIRQTREITALDLEPHLNSLLALQVRRVVFSGGEPQMHSNLAELSGVFRANAIRVTLLTAGLLLGPYARSVADTVDDVIVSLDGPPEIHNQIRRIPRAFEKLARGVVALRELRPHLEVCGRSTVQKSNYRYLRETFKTARQLGLNSISFLAADLTSDAFNRPGGWPSERQRAVALDADEVDQLDYEVEALIHEHAADIRTGYIAESEQKLRRIVLHFRACLGQTPAVAPRCNAPWVSAVIESDGTVRPCFFHPPLGNIHTTNFLEILNSEVAINFRETLDVPNNPVCRNCVCSLYFSEEKATRAQRA